MDVKTLLKKVPLITEVEKVGNTFLVGGSIRDYILRRPLADFDIVIERDFDTIVRYLKGLSRKLVLLDEVFGEVRVILDRDTWLDVSSMRGKTIEDDLRGRDFTINAIALSTKGELIDPLGGINDLKRKLIRVPSSSVLREDPLRILRAFRFISTLNLELEDKTADYIRRFRKLINIPKPERLHYEFIKLLEGESVADTLWKMQELGVLLEVLAELKPMEHTSQRYYRERSSSPLRKEQNLLFHSLLTVEKLEMLLKNLKDTPFRRGSKQLSDILSDSMRGLFLLGALLHDIGKPETITKDTEGRTHFYGHDKLGERIVESMCKRLRFSNEETDTLKKIVRLHMYPHLLVREEEITPRALFRYRRKTNSLAFPLILLAYADASASPTEERGRKNYESLFFRLSEFIEEQEKKPRERLITGYDLIDLGMTPGPIFKEILEEIEELYVTGKITTKRQALKEVKSILRSLKDKNISS